MWSVETWDAATNVQDLLTMPGATVSIVTNSPKALTEATTATTDACVEALHDGQVLLSKANGKVYAFGDRAILQCDFATPVALSSLGFWTYWSEGGRDGIAVDSIEVRRSANGVFREIPAMTAVAHGTRAVDGNNNSYGRFHATVTRADGSPLAERVSSMRVIFGIADNDWTSYTEIAAFGTPLPSSGATILLVQ